MKLKQSRRSGSRLIIFKLRVSVMDKEILKGISISVGSGEVHAVMGPNGSGKSTLAMALMGHPSYKVLGSKNKIQINGKNIVDLPTEERAKKGLFLAFQAPTAIPGVSVVNLLRSAYQEIYSANGQSGQKTDRLHNPLLSRRWQATGLTLTEFTQQLKQYARLLHLSKDFLSRGIHDGFSGGEKKKVEMLQALALRPKFAVFDEIDTGLDVDALKTVASGIGWLKKQGTGVIVITHYQRILRYVKPDFVHVLVAGKIVDTGGAALAKKIEEQGYQRYLAE